MAHKFHAHPLKASEGDRIVGVLGHLGSLQKVTSSVDKPNAGPVSSLGSLWDSYDSGTLNYNHKAVSDATLLTVATLSPDII